MGRTFEIGTYFSRGSTTIDTFEVAEKTVLETYIRETSELIHLTVNGELITTTVDHPFYIKGKSWINAGGLQVDDEVINFSGDIYSVNHIYHEVLENSVTVYNFQVEEFHTYHAGDTGVLVHNACKPEAAVLGSKKHGIKWKEGPARAKDTKIAQGQWTKPDIDYATKMANTLKSGESVIFNLPKGSTSIIHMPNGSTVNATKFWIWNKGTTWHGYPMS